MGRPKVSRFGAKLTKGDSESHTRCNYSWPGDCVAASGVGREASIGYRVAGEWEAGRGRGWMRCRIVNELERKNISGKRVTVIRPISQRRGWGSFSVWILILRSEGGAAEPVAFGRVRLRSAAFATGDRLYPTFGGRMQARRVRCGVAAAALPRLR